MKVTIQFEIHGLTQQAVEDELDALILALGQRGGEVAAVVREEADEEPDELVPPEVPDEQANP